MPWYFLFSPYSTRSQTKQFCSIYSTFHGTWGHTQFEKRSRKPGQAWSVEILLVTSDESDKINWSWNITVGTVGLLSIMRQLNIKLHFQVSFSHIWCPCVLPTSCVVYQPINHRNLCPQTQGKCISESVHCQNFQGGMPPDPTRYSMSKAR